MATYIIKYWAAEDLQSVSLLQNLASPGTLLLNGTYFNPTTSTISFTDQGFSRTVSITSVNDLSAATFTISGVQNNTVVIDNVTGPNNSTVYSTQNFDIISSVSVDMAVNAVKVGTGSNGYFPIINRIVNNNFSISTPSNSYALAFATEAVNGCIYEIFQSLDSLTGNGETYNALVADSSFISVDGPYSNNTQILQKNDVCSVMLIKVTPALPSSTLTMEFLQF